MLVRLLTMCSVVALMTTHALSAETTVEPTRSLAKGSPASTQASVLLEGSSFFPITEGTVRSGRSDAADVAPVRTASIGERSTDVRSLARPAAPVSFDVTTSLGIAETGHRASRSPAVLTSEHLLRFFASADHGGAASTSMALASALVADEVSSARRVAATSGALQTLRLAAISPTEAKPVEEHIAAIAVEVSKPDLQRSEGSADVKVKVGAVQQTDTEMPRAIRSGADSAAVASGIVRKPPLVSVHRQASLTDQVSDPRPRVLKQTKVKLAVRAAPKVARARAYTAVASSSAAAPDPQQSAAQIAALRAFTRMP